jgi:hypothetical protein
LSFERGGAQVTRPKQPPAHVIEHLARFFRRNGYVRMPHHDRRAAESRAYKKGYEVRFVANSAAELRTIQQLLKMAGFAVAKPFAHVKQWRQPLYGRQAVGQFLHLIGWTPDEPPAAGAPAGGAPGA